MSVRLTRWFVFTALMGSAIAIAPGAGATPVCTDGYKGGLPLSVCGGRVFPEADNAVDYIQFYADPVTGFREFKHGMEYLAEIYPRWVSVFTLREHYKNKDAVSAGPDGIRSYEKNDSGDGHDIFVVKLTDHKVPDKGKETLFYSLSVHGDEKGGIEGGARAVEDLAMAAENGGKIADGIKGYESTTGVKPKFNEYEVSKVLKNEVVYLVNFNSDGWVAGDHFDANSIPNAGLYTRQNAMGIDLNRQMPTVGWINPQRNPLEESEMNFGHRFMKEISDAGIGGQMAYGADIHGEGQSRAWVDIMYPAGQFDSVKHRRLMSIAERTKSMIDASLFFGIPDMIEEQTGGDGGEGVEDYGFPVRNTVPTKPARWGTVWDTLGYTDTGFIGDYLATELGVTGMDYEIAFNHADFRAYGRPWGVLLQENYINASRQIIKTAMAYAMTERKDFANFKIDPKGRVGYVFDPDRVEHDDEDGSGVLPGPNKDGVGANGEKVNQRSYSASQMDFFTDEDRHIVGGFTKVDAAEIATSPVALERLDSLVLADVTAPALGKQHSESNYYSNLKNWVKDGGNLVLTDGALEVLEEIGAVDNGSVNPIAVYQPHANIADFEHPMVAGLRKNARQLAEFTLIGFPIGNSASPMTAVTQEAWEKAGGHVVGTTNDTQALGEGGQGTAVTLGQMKFGKGQIRILGGGLHRPTEGFDHRYGLKDYALTYSGLFILENSIKHDAPGLGAGKSRSRAADSFADVMATLG